RADAVHLHPVELHLRLAAGPAAAEEHHLVSAASQPAEYLVQVELGAAGLGVLAVLPVDDEDLHGAPVSDAAVTAARGPRRARGARRDERAHDLAGDPALLGGDGEVVPHLAGDALEARLAAQVPGVERLDDAGAGSRLNSRAGHRPRRRQPRRRRAGARTG